MIPLHFTDISDNDYKIENILLNIDDNHTYYLNSSFTHYIMFMKSIKNNVSSVVANLIECT